jgi:hypothetical protein
VDPLLPLPEKLNNLNQKTDTLSANHQKHIDHLQLQLDNIKKLIPNVTQLHYDRLQNEFEEHIPNTTTNEASDHLRLKLHDLEVRVIECEQYSRRENLVISGIPDSVPQKNLQDKVLEILGAAGFKDLRPDDIQACHRLHKPRNSRYPARVIVRFLSRKIVDFCLANRERVQRDIKSNTNMNIRIFENLSKKNEESLRLCNWLEEDGSIHDHYIRNGFVKIVKTAGDRPEKINHPDYLREKFPNIPENL